MDTNEKLLRIKFKYSGEEHEVSLERLTATVVSFLDQMTTSQLTSPDFFDIFDIMSGINRFHRLLSVCQYEDDSEGFFTELLDKLGSYNRSGTIAINGVEMPYLLLVAVLEIVLPGHRFMTIKTVDALEKAANLKVPDSDREAMQKVLETYPVRLSMHTIRQMLVSRDVACQYLPFIEELDKAGHTNTWIGRFHQGILEQMYSNRVILLINMTCPVYCRFCFRKHKESRNEANPTQTDVLKSIELIKTHPDIKEVVVTGGDPFLNKTNMETIIDNLMDADHIQTLRLATRSVAYYPDLFLKKNNRLLTYLKRKHLELQETGKRIEVATHFIHPDEISPQSLMIISDLVKNGIGVYIQTPLLNNCNDEGPELVRLYTFLRGAGGEIHYIYIPCSPIQGNTTYWAPISRGHKVANYLRAHLSDRAIPRICTATPLGKIDWNTSGWAVEPVAGNENFIWIRTPYTVEYFERFAPLELSDENVRVNDEGTVDIQYMAEIGDESLFFGPLPAELDKERPETLTTEVLGDFNSHIAPSATLVETGLTGLSRVHETRVEINVNISDLALEYIKNDKKITDVIVYSDTDIVYELHQIGKLARKLNNIPHINSLRLRSLMFNYSPVYFNSLVLDILSGINKLTIINPLRLEIETRFIMAEEITDKHKKLAGLLKKKGITVYNNTPILGRINDSPQAIHDLAYRCREAGIEFNHLFVAGTALQEMWNTDNPVKLYDVAAIASNVRLEGSGREIPRYIIRTKLGEVDYGLTSKLAGKGTDLTVTLTPYDISYYRSFAPYFHWPEDVNVDEDGHPVLKLSGLLKSTSHPLV